MCRAHGFLLPGDPVPVAAGRAERETAVASGLHAVPRSAAFLQRAAVELLDSWRGVRQRPQVHTGSLFSAPRAHADGHHRRPGTPAHPTRIAWIRISASTQRHFPTAISPDGARIMTVSEDRPALV